ncbi:MAG TPA: hypothetical protein PKD91_00035 [Bacteroidia bacterium]|nr:hypothetical protein [Bacteroidia bacterium]
MKRYPTILVILFLHFATLTINSFAQNSITTTAPVGATVCTGDLITVNFTVSNPLSAWSSANFIVKLSNSAGNFSSGTTTLTGTYGGLVGNNGTFTNVLIPITISTTYSTSFKIRVEATNVTPITYTPVTIPFFYGKPTTPNNIVGPSNGLCGTYTYSSPNNTNLSIVSYLWTVNGGATIVGSNTGSSVDINFPANFVSGTITVVAKNCSGNADHTSSPRNLQVRQFPTVAAFNPVSFTVCPNTSYTYGTPAVTGLPNTTTVQYFWELPAQSIVTSASAPNNTTNTLTTVDNVVNVLFGNAVGSPKVKVTHIFSPCGTGGNKISNLTFATPPTVSVTPVGPVDICPGAIQNLTATFNANYSYVWKNGGIPIPGATTNVYPANAAGSYTVTASTAVCTKTSTPAVVVNQLPGPVANISPSGNVPVSCDGEAVMLFADAGPNYTYQWKLNGTNISGATGITHIASQSGSYTVEVNDGSPCVSLSSPSIITISPIIAVDAGSDFTFPNSNTLGGSPTATGGTGALGYFWLPSGSLNDPLLSNPNITSLTNTTTYDVVVTDAVGCSATDNILVTVNKIKINTVNSKLCQFDVIAPGGVNLTAQPAGTLTSEIEIIPTASGNYTVFLNMLADATNGIKASTISFLYDNDLIITPGSVMLSFDGVNYYALGQEFYSIENNREIKFFAEPKRNDEMVFNINHLNGVLYDPGTGPFNDFVIGMDEPSFVLTKSLEIIQVLPGGPVSVYTNPIDLQWPITAAPASGLYEFHVTLSGDNNGAVSQTFKGQFIIQ